jgi:hypothetical protein
MYWHNKGKTSKGNLNLPADFRFSGEVGRYRNKIRDHFYVEVVMVESQGKFLCSMAVDDGQMSLGRVSG